MGKTKGGGEVSGLETISVVTGSAVALIVVGGGAVIVMPGEVVISLKVVSSAVVGRGAGLVSRVVSGTGMMGAVMTNVVGGSWEAEVGEVDGEVVGDAVDSGVMVGVKGEEAREVGGRGEEVGGTVVTSVEGVVTAVVTAVAIVV